MDRLLIKGRYSTYKNSAGQKNIPIEKKRDIREDASWCVKDSISSPFPGEQMFDISSEHKDRGVYISRNDVIKKQIGVPTDSVVAKLLNAEYQYQVGDELRKKHGEKGFLETIVAPEIQPTSNQSSNWVKRTPLHKLGDEELLRIMFTPFVLFASNYYKKLKDHFSIDNNGETLDHTLTVWPNGKETNLEALLKAIRDKIWTAYKGCMTQDITDEIKGNMIDFSKTWSWSFMPGAWQFMLGERMAFGGIQEVELKGYLSEEIKAGKITVLKVRLEFIIKDWFGVDEEDIYKDSTATQVGRNALAAFWILQHQRGYKPFINRISYKETKEYIF